MNANEVSSLFTEGDRLSQVNNISSSPPEDIKRLQEELVRLQAELDECRSLVTVAQCEKENVIESEQRKCQEEVASIQKIMEEAVTEAVRNASGRYEKEISHLQKSIEKLETELEQKNKEKSDISKEGVLAAVTKSLKRVGNLGSPLPFTSASTESIENLEESMRKAQEDAEMLRSLVVPLEEEIKALKDKLRSTDEQLREYETAFASLVKGLGSDALSEMIKGKGPSEVVEHLDDKLTALSQGLQAEKASRSDLEMYVAVLNTQKAVMQEDMDKIRNDLEEVCQLLEREKKEHAQLKQTWHRANDQFLEAQRLYIMDMRQMQSVLTSEQQRQVSEMKKKAEQKMELERQLKKSEKRDEGDTVSLDGQGRKSPFSRPGSAISSAVSQRLLSTGSKFSDELDLSIDTSARARSIPENLNQAELDVFSEKRSLSSSALSRLALKGDPSLCPVVPNQTLPAKEAAKESPSTPHKLPSLTQDQLKALSDLTPEHEIRKSLLDSARAEMESFSLVGKRLVSEKEWQLLEEELKQAREKLGQPCEMCINYELQLQQVQREEMEQQIKASAAEQTLEEYKKDLKREQEFRQEMEEKFNEVSKDCENKVCELFKIKDGFEKQFLDICSKYKACRAELSEYQATVTKERDLMRQELEKISHENNFLLGKHIAQAQQMRNEEIDIPNSIDDLQLYCLQKQEELITVKAAKENMEESLKGDIQMLKNQLISEQTAKEKLEDTFTQEVDSLREQLGILASVKQELNVQQAQNADMDQKVSSLKSELHEKEERISRLHSQLDELMTAKSKLEEDIYEMKSKIQGLQTDLENSEAVQRDFVKLSQSLQMELEKIRQSDSEVRWQHEEDVVECNSCKKTFTSRKEKIHCSHCGKIFCADCLSRTVNSGPKGRQFKVCNVCHTLLDQKTAPYFSSEPPQTPS